MLPLHPGMEAVPLHLREANEFIAKRSPFRFQSFDQRGAPFPGGRFPAAFGRSLLDIGTAPKPHRASLQPSCTQDSSPSPSPNGLALPPCPHTGDRPGRTRGGPTDDPAPSTLGCAAPTLAGGRGCPCPCSLPPPRHRQDGEVLKRPLRQDAAGHVGNHTAVVLQ
jgi:hypothetical protein